MKQQQITIWKKYNTFILGGITMLNNIMTLVFIPLAVSLIAASIFWIISYKFSNIEIVFSDKLEKRKDVRTGKEEQYRYKVRVTNVGSRDLFEVYLIAKLMIKFTDGSTKTTYFHVGEEVTIPVLEKKYNRNRRKQFKDFYKKTGVWKRNTVYNYGIYIDQVAYDEFTKIFYKESIITKAKEKTLAIDDIFQAYPDAKLTIFVFGNDSVTGTRRKYESKAYTHEDIIEGRFHRFSGILWPKGQVVISRRKESKLLHDELNKIDNPQKILEKFLSFPINSSEEILKLFSREAGTVAYNVGNKKLLLILGEKERTGYC